ncbi:MAG: ATP-binding cassette domain-containing protein [Pseudomonadales bacterium]|nr:ATP-binding cassette domain-containing protein [Pseudomonadales bacterium]
MTESLGSEERSTAASSEAAASVLPGGESTARSANTLDSSAESTDSAQLQSSVIELDSLCVNYDKPVLDSLSAEMRGSCIGLLGPNGAGKTTLLNTLLGFKRPSSGKASILGHDLKSGNQWVRSMVGYMPERDAFIAGMTGIRFVRMMAELSGLSSKVALERAHEVFFYVGLGEARYRNVESYSLGMKQLAKLAQAIVHGPRLLFLDEPTNGLDPPARARMLQLIREIRDSGDTHIIIASHLLQDIESCCDEVLVLKEGRIAKYCNLEEERRSNRQFLLMQIRGDEIAFVEGLRNLGCEVALPNRRRIKAIIPEELDISQLYELAESLSVQIRNLDYKRDSLEDIFLRAMDAD